MLSMNRFFRRGDKSAGLPPGTAVYTGALTEEKIRITLFDYDAASYEEHELKDIEECFRYRDSDSVSWINLDGIHNVDFLEKLGDHFELHPLVLEDIANPWQRPKLEDYDNYLYVVAKMLAYDDQKHEITGEQVSVVLGKKFVLSFQERPGDIFEPIRERIRGGKGRIRRMGPDYLLYVLLDTIIDQYFSILERVGEQIEELEETVMVNPMRETLQDIHKLKRERWRAVWNGTNPRLCTSPLRDICATPTITPST
jgi:magnesium transporter